MTFEVTILGSNSALPAHGRHPTSQVINHNERYYLLDCGEGTQLQLSNYRVKRGKIDHIFITHLHGDHYYGLMGLLTSYHLLQRNEPLHLFGPRGLEEIVQLNFKYSQTSLVYELIFHEVDGNIHAKIFEDEELEVFTLPMKHRIPCCGYLFKEKALLRSINTEKMKQQNVPFEYYNTLKEGKDVFYNGRTIKSDEVTFPPLPKASYASCSDTLYDETILSLIKDVDLLYHESTFMEESAERAQLTFHCTALQAATIASKAGVKKLIIGHFSAKYSDLQPMLAEAQTIFANTELAVEGIKVSVRQEQY